METYKMDLRMNYDTIRILYGSAIARMKRVKCQTTGAYYDLEIFQTFMMLHGKKADYTIHYAQMRELLIIPYTENQVIFIVSLDEPMKRGAMRFRDLLFLFKREENIYLTLPFPEREIEERFRGQLGKNMIGSICDVVSRIISVFARKSITRPDDFKGYTGIPAVECSFKIYTGLLYALDDRFLFVYRSLVYIYHEQILSIELTRNQDETRFFTLQMKMKPNIVHTFSKIGKDEFDLLYEYILSKKFEIKNKKNDKMSYEQYFNLPLGAAMGTMGTAPLLGPSSSNLIESIPLVDGHMRQMDKVPVATDTNHEKAKPKSGELREGDVTPNLVESVPLVVDHMDMDPIVENHEDREKAEPEKEENGGQPNMGPVEVIPVEVIPIHVIVGEIDPTEPFYEEDKAWKAEQRCGQNNTVYMEPVEVIPVNVIVDEIDPVNIESPTGPFFEEDKINTGEKGEGDKNKAELADIAEAMEKQGSGINNDLKM